MFTIIFPSSTLQQIGDRSRVNVFHAPPSSPKRDPPGLPVFASKRAPPVRAAVRTVLRAVFAPCGASEVDDGVWRVFGETGGDGGETTVLPTSWPPGKFGSPVFFRGNGNGSESSDPGIPTRVLVSKSNVPSPDLQNFKMTVITGSQHVGRLPSKTTFCVYVCSLQPLNRLNVVFFKICLYTCFDLCCSDDILYCIPFLFRILSLLRGIVAREYKQ